MKSIKASLLAILAISSTIMMLGAAQAPDLSGTWSGPLVTNDNQNDTVKLVLTIKGSSYGGTISDELGIVGNGIALKNVVLKGNELSFAFPIVESGTEIIIKVSVKVEGDKMKGRWEDQQYGTAGAVELTRKK